MFCNNPCLMVTDCKVDASSFSGKRKRADQETRGAGERIQVRLSIPF